MQNQSQEEGAKTPDVPSDVQSGDMQPTYGRCKRLHKVSLPVRLLLKISMRL
jgi:hypothetical protein